MCGAGICKSKIVSIDGWWMANTNSIIIEVKSTLQVTGVVVHKQTFLVVVV